MSNFDELLKKQKQKDKSMYYNSINSINYIIDEKNKNYNNSTPEENIKIINQILDYFKIKRVHLPMDIKSNEEKIDYILNFANIMKREIVLEGKWWQNDALPLMCLNKNSGNYVALIPAKYGGYYFYDNKLNKNVKVNKRNSINFEKLAYCFYKPFSEESISIKDFFINMFKELSLTDIIFLFCISLFVTLMGIVIPFVNQFIFNIIIPSGTRKDILPITSLLIGVVITSNLFKLMRSIWMARVSDKIRISVQSGIWNRILNLPVSFFKKYEAGDLTKRTFMAENICDILSGSMIPVILSTIFSIIYIFQINYFSSKLVLPTIFILFLIIVFSIFSSFFRTKLNRNVNIISARLSGLIFQLYSGISKIKISGAEIRAFNKWSELFKCQLKLEISPNFIVKFSDAIYTGIMLMSTIIIYIIVYKNNISVSDYISFNAAYGTLLVAIFNFSNIVNQIAYIKPAVMMIEPILKQKPEINSKKNKVQKLNGKIEISNLSFRYNKDMDFILNNLNISIKEGEYVALVGSSGCGKSTLFRLLLGFESPEKGTIYYDNKDIEKLDIQSVRKRIGTVLQDGKLFVGDIYSNITICAPWLSLEEAFEVAKKVGFDEDIKNMPMGMFTMISENGGGISGGQKQRILIARALAMNPDILLFDEATSALDNVTQNIVVNTLSQMKNTRIVIAHRLSTIQKCDRILYLDKGKVVEEGTYEELMKLNGKFALLAKRQLI